MADSITPNTLIHINCFKLFRFRIEKQLSILDLAISTDMVERKLYRYEEFLPKAGKPLLQSLKRTRYRNIRALEEFYGVEPLSFIVRRDKDISREDLSFYHSYRFSNNSYSDKQRTFKHLTPSTKAVFFDFDGTLTYTEEGFNTWEKIWVELGYPADACFEYYRQFIGEEISHEKWCSLTLDSFQAKELTESQVKSVAKKISLVDGVEEVFQTLHRKGIKIYIVSGSINTVVDQVLGGLTQYIEDFEVNWFCYDKEGRLEHIEGTKFDFAGKRDFIVKICEELDIHPTETWFIGNDFNDECTYECGANTMCIEGVQGAPRSYNSKIWRVVLRRMKSLTDILEHLQ